MSAALRDPPMRRRELLRELEGCGARFVREGGGHTIYASLSGEALVVPRHNEVSSGVTRKLLRAGCGEVGRARRDNGFSLELRQEQTQRQRRRRGPETHRWVFNVYEGRHGRWQHEGAGPADEASDWVSDLRSRARYIYSYGDRHDVRSPPDEVLDRFIAFTPTRHPPHFRPSLATSRLTDLAPLIRQARRSPRARAVLHDALLERFPEYQRYVESAIVCAGPHRRCGVVIDIANTIRNERAGRHEPLHAGAYRLDENLDYPSWPSGIVTFVAPRVERDPRRSRRRARRSSWRWR